ncbi:MAG: ACT domain-containing protein [Gammaproteobacteria bacterium]
MDKVYMITATTENALRVLQRISGIFARHRLNIQQLNVFATANKNISFFNITVHGDEKTVVLVVKKLQRVVELLDVKITNEMEIVL